MRLIIFLLVIAAVQVPASGQTTDSVRSGDITVYYEIMGKGEPLYILTGGPGISPQYMQAVSKEFSNTHQTILVHQRGTGLTRTPANKEAITIDLYCRDIRTIRDKLGHGKINLLGHSWGGMLAMHYATTYPDDLDELILVSSGGCNMSFYSYFGNNIRTNLSEEDKQFVEILDAYFNKVWDVEMSDTLKSALKSLAIEQLNITSKAYYFDKRHAATNKATEKDIDFKVLETMVRSLFDTKWNLENKLSTINIPTLIIQGRQDPIDLETARLTQYAIKGSEFIILEKCGHFPWIEQPEKFYQTVKEFLSR